MQLFAILLSTAVALHSVDARNSGYKLHARQPNNKEEGRLLISGLIGAPSNPNFPSVTAGLTTTYTTTDPYYPLTTSTTTTTSPTWSPAIWSTVKARKNEELNNHKRRRENPALTPPAPPPATTAQAEEDDDVDDLEKEEESISVTHQTRDHKANAQGEQEEIQNESDGAEEEVDLLAHDQKRKENQGPPSPATAPAFVQEENENDIEEEIQAIDDEEDTLLAHNQEGESIPTDLEHSLAEESRAAGAGANQISQRRQQQKRRRLQREATNKRRKQLLAQKRRQQNVKQISKKRQNAMRQANKQKQLRKHKVQILKCGQRVKLNKNKPRHVVRIQV